EEGGAPKGGGGKGGRGGFPGAAWGGPRPPPAAKEPFPAKPIQMIVPFPPGGVADITGRPVAHVMGRLLKQSIVVVNKPGAGGSVGAAQAARAAADGYTILMALSSISVLPVADRLQGRPTAYAAAQ